MEQPKIRREKGEQGWLRPQPIFIVTMKGMKSVKEAERRNS